VFSAKTKNWIKAGLFVTMIAGAIVASRFISREQISQFIERAQGMGLAGYGIYAGALAVWIAAGMPASVLILGAAVAFGFFRGLAVVVVGANLGGLIGFLAARYAARDWFTQKLGRKMRLAQINRAVGESGWKIVALTRLPPVSPFSIVSYTYGLTNISLPQFMLGTALGMLPATTAFIYVVTLVGGFATGGARQRTPMEWAFYIAGGILTIIACAYLVRIAKTALARHAIEEPAAPGQPERQSPPATPS
jgi:uncharacterized membrane protein YdjX (TVP38/TMEM64 family)